MKVTRVVTECQEHPDLFFSNNTNDKNLAKEMCSYCPFRETCETSARAHQERFGIWGGVDFSEVKYDKNVNSGTNGLLGLCQNGLHARSGPGRCKPCQREKDRKAKRKHYNKLKESGKLKEVVEAQKEKQRNKIGRICRNKKHFLTTENTAIREYDGALMCQECLRRVRPVVLSQEVRKKARGYN